MTNHQHESWQLEESAKGGVYCKACGAWPIEADQDGQPHSLLEVAAQTLKDAGMEASTATPPVVFADQAQADGCPECRLHWVHTWWCGVGADDKTLSYNWKD